MLTPNDREFVNRDMEIPGLAVIFDDSAIREALRKSLPDYAFGPAKATYVRYKPGTNCLVLYETDNNGMKTFVYAKAFKRSSSKLRSAVKRGNQKGFLPLSENIVLEELAVVICIFPYDNKLKELYRLFDPSTRKEVLDRLLPAFDIENLELQGLRYKPERRYVARLSMTDGKKAVLKAYTKHGYLAAKAGAKVITNGDVLRLPAFVGDSEGCFMRAFEWLEGRKLSEIFLTPDLPLISVEAAGAALAELHSQKVLGLPRRNKESEAVSLVDVANGVSGLVPGLSGETQDLAEELGQAILNMPIFENTLHGDFYADQILYDGNSVAFVDLDRASLGDPASDIGNFLAHIEREALRGLISHERTEKIIRAFTEGYRGISGQVPIERIGIYTASGLLKLSPEPFRFREPDWPEKIDAIIDRVRAIADLITGKKNQNLGASGKKFFVPTVKVEDPFSVSDDPGLSFIRKALDPKEALFHLRKCLSCPFWGKGADRELYLSSIRVARHKYGRRALIEYEIIIKNQGRKPESFTLMGKVNAKGFRRSAYMLQMVLSRNGFGPESSVSVPEPIGVIPEFHMWLQKKVPGTPVISALESVEGVLIASRIADAAYKLHRSGIRPTRTHTIEDELRILHERLGLVSEETPIWKSRIKKLLDACVVIAADISRSRSAGIHRDFYHDQVIVHGERLYIIDLDLYSQGDPVLDIGNFIAHLTELALRTKGNADALLDIEDALVERYLELAGEELSEDIQVYKTLSLARHIYISTLFPYRKPFTEAIMEACEERLSNTVMKASSF